MSLAVARNREGDLIIRDCEAGEAHREAVVADPDLDLLRLPPFPNAQRLQLLQSRVGTHRAWALDLDVGLDPLAAVRPGLDLALAQLGGADEILRLARPAIPVLELSELPWWHEKSVSHAPDGATRCRAASAAAGDVCGHVRGVDVA